MLSGRLEEIASQAFGCGLCLPDCPRSTFKDVTFFVTVKTVAFVGCTGMHRTGCCGVTSLILHVLDS